VSDAGPLDGALNSSVAVGGDGVRRCAWVGRDEEYARYHDEEWGIPLHGDRALFEKISLEGFQAGLSWISILRRRPAFRSAFVGFDPERVSALTPTDVDRLMGDAAIIRNRAKIEATIRNAAITVELTQHSPGALDALVWSFAPAATARPRVLADVPAHTAQSRALSASLRSLGFSFVGPTTMYALMQSAGLVDDHVEGCWRATDPNPANGAG
jgi:DNA-3-methyladenine glycosylase I